MTTLIGAYISNEFFPLKFFNFWALLIYTCYDIHSKYCAFIFTEHLPCIRHYSRCQDRLRNKTDKNRQKSFLSQTLHSSVKSSNLRILNLKIFTCKRITNGDFFLGCLKLNNIFCITKYLRFIHF